MIHLAGFFKTTAEYKLYAYAKAGDKWDQLNVEAWSDWNFVEESRSTTGYLIVLTGPNRT